MSKELAIVEERYEIKEKLGAGSFAVVKRARDRETQEEVALKIIDLRQQPRDSQPVVRQQLKREIEILTSVRHEHIVSLFEVYQTNKRIYMVMEFVRGGELFDHIVELGRYSEQDASCICKNLLDAIDYLHKRNIVHRDLKPENLLCTSKDAAATDIKVTDFGLAKMTSSTSLLSTPCGTPEYVAPEVLLRKGYGPPVDMWSVGVILYILLSGEQPFWRGDGDNWAILMEQIIACKYTFEGKSWDHVSDSAKDLVSKLLMADPNARLTSSEALLHPFIRDGVQHALSSNNLDETLTKLQEFNGRRRLKIAMLASRAVHRFQRYASAEDAAAAHIQAIYRGRKVRMTKK